MLRSEADPAEVPDGVIPELDDEYVGTQEVKNFEVAQGAPSFMDSVQTDEEKIKSRPFSAFISQK